MIFLKLSVIILFVMLCVEAGGGSKPCNRGLLREFLRSMFGLKPGGVITVKQNTNLSFSVLYALLCPNFGKKISGYFIEIR